MAKEALKKELSLFQVTLAGIGVILGAGIYALIGIASGIAGNAIWLSFVIGAVIAILTGLSYAELSSIFKKDAGEYDYVQSAFNKRLALIIGIVIILAGIITAATVSLGFASYFSALFKTPIVYIGILITLILSLINYYGIKQSSWITSFSTIVETIGLIIIIILGIKYIGNVNYLEMPNGFDGVLQATALIFFAFLGFDNIIKLAEETKDPQKTIPKAIILSIIISSIIYILVAISAVSILGWQDLSISKAPLADVAARSFGGIAFLVLAIIALFSTGNTILVSLVTTSRMVYGMAEERALPKKFMLVDKKTKTPWVAVFLIMIVTILFILIGDIKLVAGFANLGLFITFAFVNLAVVVLRYKRPYLDRRFKVALNIGKFNVPAFLGFLFSAFMIYYVITGI
ncbi:MAG: amino acid permease [Nanoarchaeota archaeon]|mgnify:CR=1 FL=1